MSVVSISSSRRTPAPHGGRRLLDTQGRSTLRTSQRTGGCLVEGLESRQLLSAAPGTVVPAEATTLQVLVGSGANQFKYVAFNDAAGVERRFELRGPGAAAVNFTGTNLQTTKAAGGGETVTGTGTGIDTIALSGTSSRTAVKFSARVRKFFGVAVPVAGLSANSPVGSITGNADFTGPVTINGAIGKIDVTGLSGGSVSTTTTDPVTGQPITTTTPATFTSGAIGSINVAGNLGENLTSSGAIGKVTVRGNVTGSITADQIKSLDVTGNVSGSTITLNQPFSRRAAGVGRLTVRGTIANTTVKSASSIGPVNAGDLSGDNFYAGVTLAANNLTGLPATIAEVPSQASIGTVKSRTTAATNFAAFNVGRLSLGALNTSNAGTRFGVAAASIAGINGTASVNGKRFNFGRLKDPTTAQNDLTKAGLSGTDFVILIL